MSNQKFSSVAPSSSSSIAPSSLHIWTHDVFPSFRGEDVRVGFLSHIQKEFQRTGINTFIDNEIKRGKSISPELKQAIRRSKIAIILLSKNYASSKWCLNELVEIMKCRKEFRQTVKVIFYKVAPSDVKKLIGCFGKVFENTCVGKSEEDIKRWKESLTEVATIAGYCSVNWNNEADMIEKIATDVSNELITYALSNDFNNLIGMRAHMEKIEPMLHLDSDEVRMIGIWGPSGIGKSTIARFLFSKHSHQFQLSVFMDDIKTRIQSPFCNDYNAKLQLQKQFLSQLFWQKDVNINHLGVIQERLKHKRVLVVLDDVNHLLQLEAMAKETQWFGRGSRIIITTQDKKILIQHRINEIYELLSGNLPVGLMIMGSYVKGMDRYEWEKELPRLRTNLVGDIKSVLRFSYDSLLEEDKGLFLYIACFFNNERIEKVEACLATKFSDVRRGLHVLVEKSLISINYYIQMHDLLIHLGREIVRGNPIQDVKKCKFLNDVRDICQILRNDTLVAKNIIGMDFECSQIMDELYQSDSFFDRMRSLQFLRIRSYYKPSRSYFQSPYFLPQKLMFLHWEQFSMKNFASNFNPEFLIELNMYDSKLEKLWEESKSIQNLKWINLSESEDLKELPDLSSVINLKKLKLKGCSSLVKLPSSIGYATNLKQLNLMHCSSMEELPFSIGNLSNLEILNLSDCSNLLKLPSSIWSATNLKILDLSYCTNLMELPFSIENAINLEELDLKDCSSLVKLPSSIGYAINLKKLLVIYCTSLMELPSSIENAINLKELNLEGCSSLVEIPSSIARMLVISTY